MKTKFVEMHLGYYKQGDDLGHCLTETKTVYEAMQQHALMLREVAEHLESVAKEIESLPEKQQKIVSCDANTHFIGLTLPEALAEKLIKEELVSVNPFEDEEE